jgi:putative membrane protein
MLAPLQGERVVTKGSILRSRGNIYLYDRDSGAKVGLVFKDPTLRQRLGHTRDVRYNKVWITGTVCRSMRPGKRYDGMLWASLSFALSGGLGLLLLNNAGILNRNPIPVVHMGLTGGDWMMVPMFTGLFGLPTLLLSLFTNPVLPKQDLKAKELISSKQKAKGLMKGTVTGALVGWYPGITSAEAGVLVAQATTVSDDDADGMDPDLKVAHETEEFIISVSAINTANAISNFVALFVIFHARSGAARAAEDILGYGLTPWTKPLHPPWQLSMILMTVLLSGIFAFFITLRIGKAFARNLDRISYRSLALSIIIFLVILVLVFSGPLGIVIMLIATAIGLVPPLVGVKRVHLMGCLVLPLLLTWSAPFGLWGWRF